MSGFLKKREKFIAYLTLGVIIFSVGFNLLIVPVIAKNDNLNKEINLTLRKLKKYLWLLNRKDYIQKKYSKFSSTFRISGQYEDTLVGVLAELENLAKAGNVKIVDIRPLTTTGNLALYKEILVDLRTEGTIEGYLRLIYNLESSLSLLRIKELQLTAKPNSDFLEGNFSVSQISLPEQEQ